ncbi:MAG: Ribonuclease P protein component [Candidatus Woesebacteria bacterium GW2011_GWA1_39_21b]|uniref:Ribonuclease P protein component n=2 Tax=Patescibacteria group TaxID=1783273 RepID=A0A1G2QBA9_9BACT|nr:MAG: Ribonuclease P protein component [Candidatus Woesebacteria bacterium GW2011_GWA1_39_21b]KKS77471.1 MAG: Ribonuclease P protein component [Parcubacteria group bacterium GW2011_GWB1_42_9]KKS88994.1 MAG: Ribonuclease P protein component [Parcubacteria group bacterium GW2011_GWC1_43_11b]OHA57787.1 MAG: ribonuclease P protein component [Candidatus Vogelbacteria bacterium RIFOXYB1_FULL_42_16]
MLSKSRRIEKSDLAELIRSGRSFQSPLFTIRAFKTTDQKPSRLAVVVAKKTAPKAVTRNFLKRRLKYALVKRLAEIKPGFCIAFWLKQDLSQIKYQDFEQKVFELLGEANLLLT